MNDHRLQSFLDPPADPGIPNHAQDMIQSELQHRRQEELAAYASTFEEEQHSSQLVTDDIGAIETFDEPDFHDDSLDIGDLPTQSLNPDEAMEVVQSIDIDSRSNGAGVTSGNPVTQLKREGGLDEQQAEALLQAYTEAEEDLKDILRAKQIVDRIIGEVVLEAAVMVRASDTMWEVCSKSSEIMLLNQETIDKLVRHIWDEYSEEERAEYLETIFEGSEDEVISLVVQLAEKSELGVQRE